MIDAFNRRHVYLRLGVTDRCNLRCRYCMPARGVQQIEHGDILSFEELERVVAILAGAGIRKVRLTGGEPTVRRGIVELARRLAGIGGVDTLALTTNGVLLNKLAGPLAEAGVSLLNISIDSLRRERYAEITGRDLLPQVLAGIETALAAGFSPLKLNVVIMAGVNDDELCDFAELAMREQLNVRFIEYMPFLGNSWSEAQFMPYRLMLQRIEQRYRLKPFHTSATRDSTAKDFMLVEGAGSVSFITPLSEEFCTRCNRLRITADGQLKTCLFAPPKLDLRLLLRAGATDAQILDKISSALINKPAAHPPVDVLPAASCQPMTQIGG